MRVRRCQLRLLFVAVATIAGCRWIGPTSAERNLLGEPRQPTDRVELEIVFVKLPPLHEQLSERLWQHADEQILPTDLRGTLHDNGFRVGLMSGQLPPEITRLLGLTSHSNQLEQSMSSETLAVEPIATMRLIQTRSGRKAEIIASHVYDQLPLLSRVGGELQGKSFEKAEARFELLTAVQKDDTVHVSLLPELHHGNAQIKFVGGDGVLRPEPSRPKRTFDELKIAAPLNPGQMLVISSLADCPGSVGHYFFTQPSGDNLIRKLIIVRVANTGPKSLFDEDADEPQTVVGEISEVAAPESE